MSKDDPYKWARGRNERALKESREAETCTSCKGVFHLSAIVLGLCGGCERAKRGEGDQIVGAWDGVSEPHDVPARSDHYLDSVVKDQTTSIPITDLDEYHAFKANEIDVRVAKLPGEHAYGFMISRAPMADGAALMPWCRFKVAAEIVEQAMGNVDDNAGLVEHIDSVDGAARFRCQSFHYFEGERVQCDRARGHKLGALHERLDARGVQQFAWTDDACENTSRNSGARQTLANVDGIKASRIERGATYVMSIELPDGVHNSRATEKYADRIASWAEGISKISGATVLPIIFDAGATMKLIEVQPAFNTACELYMLGKFLTLFETILRRDYR